MRDANLWGGQVENIPERKLKANAIRLQSCRITYLLALVASRMVFAVWLADQLFDQPHHIRFSAVAAAAFSIDFINNIRAMAAAIFPGVKRLFTRNDRKDVDLLSARHPFAVEGESIGISGVIGTDIGRTSPAPFTEPIASWVNFK